MSIGESEDPDSHAPAEGSRPLPRWGRLTRSEERRLPRARHVAQRPPQPVLRHRALPEAAGRLGLHGAGPLTDKPHRQRGKRPCPLSVSSETPAGSQARKFWPLSQSSSDPLQSRPATTIIYIYTYVSFLRPHKRLITKIPLHNHMHDHIHIYTYESFLREYDCNTLA